jgi:tRNA threonylcarbamoyladenosine biosynthesis protein TsaE
VSSAVRLVTEGPADTRAVAGALAPLAVPGDIVLLVGDLGAGKTAFAQGFGAALGIVESMTSPTFTLVRQYELGDRPGPGGLRTLFHADLYRLDHLAEIADLGLGELVEDGGVALVEWGDVARPLLGRGSLQVRLEASDVADERRLITLEPTDDTWLVRWDDTRRALARWEVAA